MVKMRLKKITPVATTYQRQHSLPTSSQHHLDYQDPSQREPTFPPPVHYGAENFQRHKKSCQSSSTSSFEPLTFCCVEGSTIPGNGRCRSRDEASGARDRYFSPFLHEKVNQSINLVAGPVTGFSEGTCRVPTPPAKIIKNEASIRAVMSAKAAAGVFIVGAKRTPFGAFGGKLSKLTPTGIVIASNLLSILFFDEMNLDLLPVLGCWNMNAWAVDACCYIFLVLAWHFDL